MTGAAFDDADRGFGDQAQHFGRFLAHVLSARMAGDVQCNTAVERLQTGRQPLLAGDVDNVFGRVEGRLGQFPDRRVVRHDQRPLELEHQRAGRHQRDDVIALVDIGFERCRDLVCRLGDLGEVAGLQLRHAAAAGIDDFGLDPVARQYPEASPRQCSDCCS